MDTWLMFFVAMAALALAGGAMGVGLALLVWGLT